MEYKKSCADGGETPTYLAIANKLLARRSARTSLHWLRLIQNVETSFGEQADFARSGSHAEGWGKRWGSGCVYLAQQEIPVFLIAAFPKNEKENLSIP